MKSFLFSFSPTAILVWIMIMIFLMFYFLGKYYFFKKIGEDGWNGIVPIYSEWVYFKKAKVNPFSAVALLILFIVFSILGVFCEASNFLVAICTFFQVVSLLFYVLLSWKVNYFISKKFKKSWITALCLTLAPILAFPIIGLSSNYRWSRFVKVNDSVIDEEFYNKKVSLGEMCLTNVFRIMCVVAGFYIFIYSFVAKIPSELLLQVVLSREFVIVIVISFSIVTILATLFGYYGDKMLKKSMKK